MKPWLLLLLCAPRAEAATVEICLRVDAFQIAGPNGTATVGPFGNPAPIPMWGFVTTGTGAGCAFAAPSPAPTANVQPFPRVNAVEGDTLIIHLRNNLPPAGTAQYVPPPAEVAPAVYTEPVSVIIPGQTAPLTPTWTDGTTGDRTSPSQRVRSFTHETPQQSSSDYTFGPLKAGTYLIQSGTHPAIQLQMGLYGVLAVLPTTAGRAYDDASSIFNSEATLLLSDIDPVLHAAIAAGTFGSAPAAPNPDDPAALLPPGWLTSAVQFHPKYFLVNGKPFTSGTAATSIGGLNRRVLLRFLNAGLETHVPVLQGQYVSIIAEDGGFLSASGLIGGAPGTCPAPRVQYSVPLAAGKTSDAILRTPASAATIQVYDRRLRLSNNGAAAGGIFTVLTTAASGGNGPPPPAPPTCTLVGK